MSLSIYAETNKIESLLKFLEVGAIALLHSTSVQTLSSQITAQFTQHFPLNQINYSIYFAIIYSI